MLRTAFRFLARVSIIPFGRPVSLSHRAPRADGRPAGAASPFQRARAVLGTVACTLALGGALAACSPTFDWRTIMNNDNGYTVDLPAKPDNDQRAVQIDGKPMQMAMQTAEAGDAVFAVGTVMLPSDDEATQRAALEFLRTGLARNVGAAPDAHAVQIPLAAGGKVLGLEMKLSGEAGSQHETRTVYARLVARGRHVYQAAIIASKPVQQEQVDQFFSSFQLY
ncbi:hypothetical protein LMG24238_03940 [Paraburkholderia sediminicola]|uniref:Transmembrane protein n=1 Tax=Paraburkholderia sediminicola TaxID=458836 RepID=A0A6J5BI44_9BURK|nr:hypothetical protein [Paraburkholderia sediminicola]CAB3706731.1 hypothetical protein LMG24238_03940 [Paraburkholderia sediminicola]